MALIFLVVGYQAALFVHKATLTKIASDEAAPDTVYVVERISVSAEQVPRQGGAIVRGRTAGRDTLRRAGRGAEKLEPVREAIAPKGRVESFRFDPNVVTVDELRRLGFSPRQARAIDNYRLKGGRFRRREDFAKSYVVADSVYERLKEFIVIPLMDINAADSSELITLPGIGPFLAGRIVEYRRRLRGFSFPEQLMDIYRIDSVRYEGLKDLVCVRELRPYPLWTLPEDSLSRHPYIGRHTARSIVLYRENHAPGEFSIKGILDEGLVPDEYVDRFGRLVVETSP